MLTIYAGGVNSGKSRAAERYALEIPGWETCQIDYLATLDWDGSDNEMAKKVKMHQDRRGSRFNTVEVGGNLAKLTDILKQSKNIVLLDSLGTLVSSNIDSNYEMFLEVVQNRSYPTIIVAELVGFAVHANTHVGRAFENTMTRLLTELSLIAENFYLVFFGRIIDLNDAKRL